MQNEDVAFERAMRRLHNRLMEQRDIETVDIDLGNGMYLRIAATVVGNDPDKDFVSLQLREQIISVPRSSLVEKSRREP